MSEEMNAAPFSKGRRAFIAASGAIVVSFSLRPSSTLGDEQNPAKPTPSGLPSASFNKAPLLDSWIRIGADGTITVFTGKAELGQGVSTALRQIAADQLAVPFERITLITADTAQTPDEGYTAGSNSMKDSGTAIMHASAQVRELLAGLAAARLSVPAEQLKARDGAMYSADGRHAEYGALAAGQALHVTAQPQ